ncbi:hypothetical protein PR048_023109 [Dryococelus australis]|uniref:Uncharacterized protein n=1 Tax=Dryococelus australis TaxID=614101 RepID=A0ABQ9GT90_9NEOP|nr:hypothetical protein PR048_023109 [Dryococelus australis]
MTTGDSFHSLRYAFRISHCYTSVIVAEVVSAICRRLLHILVPVPSEDALRANAIEFWESPMSFGSSSLRRLITSRNSQLHAIYKQPLRSMRSQQGAGPSSSHRSSRMRSLGSVALTKPLPVNSIRRVMAVTACSHCTHIMDGHPVVIMLLHLILRFMVVEKVDAVQEWMNVLDSISSRAEEKQRPEVSRNFSKVVYSSRDSSGASPGSVIAADVSVMRRVLLRLLAMSLEDCATHAQIHPRSGRGATFNSADRSVSSSGRFPSRSPPAYSISTFTDANPTQICGDVRNSRKFFGIKMKSTVLCTLEQASFLHRPLPKRTSHRREHSRGLPIVKFDSASSHRNDGVEPQRPEHSILHSDKKRTTQAGVCQGELLGNCSSADDAGEGFYYSRCPLMEWNSCGDRQEQVSKCHADKSLMSWRLRNNIIEMRWYDTARCAILTNPAGWQTWPSHVLVPIWRAGRFHSALRFPVLCGDMPMTQCVSERSVKFVLHGRCCQFSYNTLPTGGSGSAARAIENKKKCSTDAVARSPTTHSRPAEFSYNTLPTGGSGSAARARENKKKCSTDAVARSPTTHSRPAEFSYNTLPTGGSGSAVRAIENKKKCTTDAVASSPTTHSRPAEFSYNTLPTGGGGSAARAIENKKKCSTDAVASSPTTHSRPAEARLHSRVYARASSVCSSAAVTVLPHTWHYGVGYLLLSKFLIGSEASRTCLMNCNPTAKTSVEFTDSSGGIPDFRNASSCVPFTIGSQLFGHVLCKGRYRSESKLLCTKVYDLRTTARVGCLNQGVLQPAEKHALGQGLRAGVHGLGKELSFHIKYAVLARTIGTTTLGIGRIVYVVDANPRVGRNQGHNAGMETVSRPRQLGRMILRWSAIVFRGMDELKRDGNGAAPECSGEGNGRYRENPPTIGIVLRAIPTCESPGVTRLGIGPGSPRREASRLTAQTPRPLHC